MFKLWYNMDKKGDDFMLNLIKPPALKKGDKIVTVGGIYGVVAEVKENHLLVEVDNGVKIKVDKTCVVNDITDVQGK